MTRLLRPHRRSDEEDSFLGVFTFPSSGTFTLNICVLSFPLVYAQYCLYHCTLFFHTLFPLSLTFFSLWHFSSLPLFSTVHGRTFRCIIRHNLSSSHMRREKKALPYLLSHSTFLLFFFVLFCVCITITVNPLTLPLLVVFFFFVCVCTYIYIYILSASLGRLLFFFLSFLLVCFAVSIPVVAYLSCSAPPSSLAGCPHCLKLFTSPFHTYTQHPAIQ